MRNDRSDPYDLETLELRCEQAWLRFMLSIYDFVLGKPEREAKFNPHHDQLGRFTFAPGGGGGGASHSNASGHHEAHDIGTGHKDHYETSDPKFQVPTEIRPKLNEIAREFNSATGKTLVVTSVARDANAQAKAMFVKFDGGSSGSEYLDKTALREIHDAYVINLHQGKSPDDIIRSMQSVISAQMARGVYISKHLKAGAIDIRTKFLTDAEISRILDIASRHGVRAIREDIPKHIHMQF